MTPAIEIARKQKLNHTIHEYTHDPASDSYGLEAAEQLQVPAASVFKTLVVSLDKRELAVALLPVCSKLSMKRLAKAVGAKKAVMAGQQEVARATGYVLGGVSPLGQKKRLKAVIDASAQKQATIFVSAGRRGLEIELQPLQLSEQINASFAEICQQVPVTLPRKQFALVS